MRLYNQEILEKISELYSDNYNHLLLKKISALMNKWAIEFDKVTNEIKK